MISQVFIPLVQFNQYKKYREIEEEYKYFQIKVVKTFYPVLMGMTFEEIDQKYGLNKVYDTVGKLYLHNK